MGQHKCNADIAAVVITALRLIGGRWPLTAAHVGRRRAKLLSRAAHRAYFEMRNALPYDRPRTDCLAWTNSDLLPAASRVCTIHWNARTVQVLHVQFTALAHKARFSMRSLGHADAMAPAVLVTG